MFLIVLLLGLLVILFGVVSDVTCLGYNCTYVVTAFTPNKITPMVEWYFRTFPVCV